MDGFGVLARLWMDDGSFRLGWCGWILRGRLAGGFMEARSFVPCMSFGAAWRVGMDSGVVLLGRGVPVSCVG